MKTKLTKRAVEGAKPGPRDLFLWDAQVSGFGCKVTPRGRRVLVLQYWAHGRARRMTLGRYGPELTVDQARTKAKRLRGQVADGGDPAAARATAQAMPTLAGLTRIKGNSYLLPGKWSGHHFVGLEKAWFRLRKRAGLEDVRLHDLRHTHASVGASTGESLVLIGGLYSDTAIRQRHSVIRT